MPEPTIVDCGFNEGDTAHTCPTCYEYCRCGMERCRHQCRPERLDELWRKRDEEAE